MKKYECCIVTFYNAINYGAVLQTYALKKMCNTFYPTHIYKHQNRKIKRLYNVNPLTASTSKEAIIKAIRFIANTTQKHRFNSFIRRYLINDYPKSDNIFYITGSDQVWNYDCSDFDKTYFLEFVEDDQLKNSYAASFGFKKQSLVQSKYEQH